MVLVALLALCGCRLQLLDSSPACATLAPSSDLRHLMQGGALDIHIERVDPSGNLDLRSVLAGPFRSLPAASSDPLISDAGAAIDDLPSARTRVPLG